MADRTSAALFSTVFGFLAEHPDERNKVFAKRLWRETREYDFTSDQMSCDEDLIALGLAKLGIDPEYPEDGETVLYLDEDYED